MARVLGKTASGFLQKYYLAPDHPMKLRLWYGLLRMLGYPRLVVPYDGCGWISLDMRDLLQRKIFVQGAYEEEVWEALSRIASRNEVLWDVGAHIGIFSIRALLDTRFAEVHCFEPNPAIAEILEANLALNGGAYCCHQLALNDVMENRPLFLGPGANTGLTTLEKDLDNGTVTVECLTVDEIIARNVAPPPTLMKIDVEGSEGRILYGAQNLLEIDPPNAIVFETACDSTGRICDSQLSALLKENAFEINHLERVSGELQSRENYIAWHARER